MCFEIIICLTFLGTRFQDGRNGLQGVSKVCRRAAPEDPNVAPAVPNVAHGAVKVAAGVSQGAQGGAKGAQAVPKGAQRVPMVCPRWLKGPHQHHNHEQTHKRAKEHTNKQTNN